MDTKITNQVMEFFEEKLAESIIHSTIFDTIINIENDRIRQIKYKNNKEFLYKRSNSIKRRFYYFRDKQNFPRITVCTIYDINKRLAVRGLALCGPKDIMNKEYGRDLAEDRAIVAYKTEKNSEKIQKRIAADVVDSCVNYSLSTECDPYDFKSQFNINLTDYERSAFKLE